MRKKRKSLFGKMKVKHRARGSRFSFYDRRKKPDRIRKNRNKYTPHMGKKQLAKLEKRTTDLVNGTME